MAFQDEDFKIVSVITSAKRSTGVVSGSVTTLGFDRATIFMVKNAFSGKNSKVDFNVAHGTSSISTYASGTALSSADGTTTSAGQINIWTGDLRGLGPKLLVTLSSITASADAGVFAYLSRNDRIPPASTGFTTVTYYPANP